MKNYINLSNFFNRLSNFEDGHPFMDYRNKFLEFRKFVKDEYMNGNDILIADEITQDNINEYYFNKIVFDKKYLSNWNSIILSHIIHFWDYNGNKEELEKEYYKIQQLQKLKSANFILNYFSFNYFKNLEEENKYNEIKKEYVLEQEKTSDKNTTYFKVIFVSENIPFYIKEIIQKWITNTNFEFEKMFFNIGMDKEIKDIKIISYQQILNNTGIDKSINFHYRITSKNSIVNEALIKKTYLSRIDDLKYFTLENNFKTLNGELEELAVEEDFQLFGNIYYEINTKQKYILKKFRNLLNDLGISIVEIDKKEMYEKKSYNVLNPHTLFKYNLKI